MDHQLGVSIHASNQDTHASSNVILARWHSTTELLPRLYAGRCLDDGNRYVKQSCETEHAVTVRRGLLALGGGGLGRCLGRR
jgi:hypothetical protein